MTTASQLKESPYRVSSVYYKQLSLGAKFTRDEDGWIRAEYFTGPEDETERMRNSVGLCDMSHLGKLSLKRNDITDSLRKELGNGVDVRPLAAIRGTTSVIFKDALICVLTRNEAFVTSRMRDSGIIRAQLEKGRLKGVDVTDLTSYFTGLYMIGPKSRDVICNLSEVNVNPELFPNFTVSQVPLFHVRSILLRQDIDGVLGFQIYFDRGFGEYLWDRIMRAGKEFAIAPVGSSALRALGWEWI